MTREQPCKEKWPAEVRRHAAALYVHVPWCRAKCRYCDFYSIPVDVETAGQYVRAAARELAWRAPRLTRPAESIFLGGGTPTALPPKLLGDLLGALAPWMGPRTEVSVEANPGAVSEETARMLPDAGVNRVNLGVQSFHAEELAVLGRIHGPDEVAAAVDALRAAGLQNLGLDLIYGVPGQTLSRWRESVHRALAMAPEHLSCYALAYEQGTPLTADRDAGRVLEMPEEEQRACYEAAIAMAADAGLAQYEISNFARENRACRHNMTYWRNEPYVGLGPAAVSYLDGVRSRTAPDVAAYCRAWRRGEPPPAERERLEEPDRLAETLMLGLRLREGLDRRAIAERFGVDPLAAAPVSIRRHAETGMLDVTADRVRLTEAALFVSDAVAADILAEARQAER